MSYWWMKARPIVRPPVKKKSPWLPPGLKMWRYGQEALNRTHIPYYSLIYDVNESMRKRYT